jgi:indole-3-glycerol phosphate synthase
MLNDLLPAMVASARRSAEERWQRHRAANEREAADRQPHAGAFSASLRVPGIRIIAECKRRSPSRGILRAKYDPAAIALGYEMGGAAAVSVLTEPTFFDGHLDHLRAVRAATRVPLLRKDFIVIEPQIVEARAAGADAVLLIVAALPDDGLLRDLHELAVGIGLGVLVESHDDDELERALSIGARIVGVNARNLGTFAEDLTVGERLAARVPADVVAIAESAIRSLDDAARMAAAGFDAVLVGEMLVKSTDPTAAVRGLASVARSPR